MQGERKYPSRLVKKLNNQATDRSNGLVVTQNALVP